ncbi:hypothetical protein DENSPDRAFT_542312 [Dentipellis sp. KUC8613]|nr:hypothetical protein DENSPDRAFT_542312 [Dentipellis sp. KUC8613]
MRSYGRHRTVSSLERLFLPAFLLSSGRYTARQTFRPQNQMGLGFAMGRRWVSKQRLDRSSSLTHSPSGYSAYLLCVIRMPQVLRLGRCCKHVCRFLGGRTATRARGHGEALPGCGRIVHVKCLACMYMSSHVRPRRVAADGVGARLKRRMPA